MINNIFNPITYEIDISLIKQDFRPLQEYKEKYGEVNTPFNLIEEMLNLFPNNCFMEPSHKWLDPAGGYGYFTIILYNRLMNGLREIIKSPIKRSDHILKNMIYICELNESHIQGLRQIFYHKNIICNNFLSTTVDSWREIIQDKQEINFEKSTSANVFSKEFNGFDYIIGNPPYNSNGLKKVPTNTKQDKKKDGKTVWADFVKHSISLLRNNGLLNMITPSIWMKPDKAKMYNYMLQYKIHKLRSFTNTETNKLFKGQAQTPTCFYLLEKIVPLKNTYTSISLYNITDKLEDKEENKYYEYKIKIGNAIPLLGCSIIYKIQNYMEKNKISPLIVYKTNMPSINITLQKNKSLTHMYSNIKTCILSKEQIKPRTPTQIIEYSNKPCKYYGEKKLVLAHKMYGYPYLDEDGIYGISNRDNYIILAKDYENSISKLREIQHFLNTKLVRFIYESTRYRMKYLEKYAFEFIPDITMIQNTYLNYNENNSYELQLYNLFGFTNNEIEFITIMNKSD